MREHTRYQTYGEFWPFYLGEHNRAGTRALRLLGTVLGSLTSLHLESEYE